MKTLKKDNLIIKIYDTRAEMGKYAAAEAAERIRILLKEKHEISMVFAAAPSQNEFLAALIQEKDIEWERINAFHMDEYLGLPDNAPQRFGMFLKNFLFSKLPFKTVNYVNGTANAENECARYAELLKKHKIDIVCMGVGENGHIAFNDPHVAMFNDPQTVKKVELDEKCRLQQVNDGCFAALGDVPKYALTLTIPALFEADYIFCVVPAKSKSVAVCKMINDAITEKLPASILRNHNNAVLYCDRDSGAYLL